MENKDKTLMKWQYLLLVGILTLLIASGGYLYYRHQASNLRKEKHNELQAIAELKIRELVQWRKERKADARTIANGPFFIRGVEQWLFNKTNIALKKNIADRLVITQKEHGYESIILASPKGDPLLSVGKPVQHFDLVASEKVIVAAKFDSIQFSDFYYCKLENTIHYDVIAPLVDEKGFTIAVLLLRINPYDYLYPFIQSWPTPSKSSETLILRKEGDSVLFLNDLRFRTGAALTLKIPMARKDIPAVQSILGSEGIFEGKDYRGVEVLSDIRRVPGTSWSMVAKVDQNEMYSDLYQQSIIISVLTGILMLLCGIGIMWIYHFRQRNIYRTLWQVQEEFRTTLYSIGDAVITTDRKGRVQHLNQVAEQLTGWKEKDAKNKPNEEVFHIINEVTRIKTENPVQLVLKEEHVVGLANHTLLISKDGREIPIADSGSPIRNEEGEIVGVVLVFRDQTEERTSQKALLENEKKFRQVFEASNVGKSMTLPTGEINVNDAFCKMLGYTAEELKNKKWQDLTPADEVENTQIIIDALLKGEKNSARFYKQYIKKDGSIIWADVSVALLRDDKNKPLHFITTVIDITARKCAEEALDALLKRQKAILSSVPDIIMEVDNKKKYTWANEAGIEFFGEDVIGKEADYYFEGEQETYETVQPLFQGKEKNIYVESWQRRKDGEKRLLAWWCRVLKDSAGNVTGALSSAQDITEHKQAELMLRESEKRLSRFYNSGLLGVIYWNMNGQIIGANDKFLEMVGYTRDDLTGGRIDWMHMTPSEFRHLDESSVDELKATGVNKTPFEKEYIRKDGSRIPVIIAGAMLDEARFQGVAFVLDITERKRAEEEILKLNRTYAVLSNINQLIVRERDRQKLFEGACKIAVEDGKFILSWIGMLDETTKRIKPVASAGSLDGYLEHLQITISDTPERQGPIGTALREGCTVICNDIEHDKRVIPWRDQALALGYRSLAAFPLRADLTIKGTMNFYSSEVQFFDKEEIRLLEELAMDVSFALKTLATEENIRNLSNAVEQSGSSITIANLDGDIEYVNPKFIELTGYSAQEAVGKNPRILKSGHTSDEGYKQLWNTITDGQVWHGEFHNKKKNGELYWESATISPIKNSVGKITHFIAVKEDITQQKAMAEELRQIQKLEGLGTLAGGIAHDFNNILGIILGYNTSIKMFKDDSKKINLATETIAKAVDRGKTLVQQVLTFARKTETAFGAVNVNDVVMETVTMIYEMFPKTITCSQNFDKSIPYINADRSQLHQALMNLCVNARDAMPKGGVLAINTRMVSVASLRYQHPDASGSSYVCIEVSDTGEGMTEEIRKRIFEPFFTTKGIGKGTGLGLSVTFGVIQSHKGYIDVESELGNLPAGKAGGTTFRLYLPASQVASPIIEVEEKTLEEIPGGTETLLVVEDEEMLLASLQMVLVEKGYNVLSAGEGLKAIKIYQEKKNEITLVITDLGLPNMTGMEVCQRIKIINPKQHIMLASGYLDPETKTEFLKIGIEHFLYKPYDLSKVLKMVREVLDEK